MKTLTLFLALSLSLLTVSVMAQQPAPAPDKHHAASHPSQDPGERAYQANCARCHSAPEQLSRTVTPAVVMHMRVRADISEKDAQLIKKYLAP